MAQNRRGLHIFVIQSEGPSRDIADNKGPGKRLMIRSCGLDKKNSYMIKGCNIIIVKSPLRSIMFSFAPSTANVSLPRRDRATRTPKLSHTISKACVVISGKINADLEMAQNDLQHAALEGLAT